jgi:hypothetical protein
VSVGCQGCCNGDGDKGADLSMDALRCKLALSLLLLVSVGGLQGYVALKLW